MDKIDVFMLIMICDGAENMNDDEEDEFYELQKQARKKMQFHLLKREHGKMLKNQLNRMFLAWDEQEGGESSLNCLDITAITQQAINDYLNQKK
jgi:hypothetical protein